MRGFTINNRAVPRLSGCASGTVPLYCRYSGGLNIAGNEASQFFSDNNVSGAYGSIDAVCVGSPVIIANYFQSYS